MSQCTVHPFNQALLVRDTQGRYGPASVDQILEAARRAIALKMPCGVEFNSPPMVKEYFCAKLAGFEHEIFAALFLDLKHRLIEYSEIFRGTLREAAVYPREVVKEALRLNASAVILAHNHPSGAREPSEPDKILTRHVKEALALVEVRTLDHIIVAGTATFSFAESGLL